MNSIPEKVFALEASWPGKDFQVVPGFTAVGSNQLTALSAFEQQAKTSPACLSVVRLEDNLIELHLLNGAVFKVRAGDVLGDYVEPENPAKAYTSDWDQIIAQQMADLESRINKMC